MEFILRINCDNAAFEGADLYPELSQILSHLAVVLPEGVVRGRVRDTSGNTCGEWELVHELARAKPEKRREGR